MKDCIKFLVLWIGTRCSLHCKNCGNLIPYSVPESYEIDKIIENLNYITQSVTIEELQIQGGEPFTHKELDRIIVACAENHRIGKIEIATNGTIVPDDNLIAVLKKYKERICVRFSEYSCVNSEKRQAIINLLLDNNINATIYQFIYGDGMWFDTGTTDTSLITDEQELKEMFGNCSNKYCWTLAEDNMVCCGKMIVLSQIKGMSLDNSNLINVTCQEKTTRILKCC